MLKINYDKSTYQVKNNLNEILIKDFENITNIFNDKDKQYFERWSDILVYLGLPTEVVDNLDTDDFINIIQQFNIKYTDGMTIEKSIEVDGEIYQAFEEEFKLTVKEMAMLESYITKNENRYLGDIMAVIYKRPGFDKTINYDKSHIHHKAELFRKTVTADKVVPVISYLSKRLVKEYNNNVND